MIMTTRRSIAFRISMGLIGLLLMVSTLFLSGCGIFSSTRRETKMLYEDVSGSSGTYQKIMATLPFENTAQWAATDLNAVFAQEIKKVLESECNRVRVLLPGSPGFPASFNNPAYSADGDLDSVTLSAEGRASCINLIFSGRLAGIQHVTEDRGLFWFAKVIHLARIQMDFAIYHTDTGAKVLDRTVFHNIEITEAEGDLIDAREMPETVPLDEALTEVAKTIGTTACNVIKHIPWEGYISSVEGDRIVLSAGEQCGLKKGNVLTVYHVDEVTSNESPLQFFSPGVKVGRITVTSVYSDRSEAVLKDGGPILPGSVVRAK